jgi:hypothetical protein
LEEEKSCLVSHFFPRWKRRRARRSGTRDEERGERGCGRGRTILKITSYMIVYRRRRIRGRWIDRSRSGWDGGEAGVSTVWRGQCGGRSPVRTCSCMLQVLRTESRFPRLVSTCVRRSPRSSVSRIRRLQVQTKPCVRLLSGPKERLLAAPPDVIFTLYCTYCTV